MHCLFFENDCTLLQETPIYTSFSHTGFNVQILAQYVFQVCRLMAEFAIRLCKIQKAPETIYELNIALNEPKTKPLSLQKYSTFTPNPTVLQRPVENSHPLPERHKTQSLQTSKCLYTQHNPLYIQMQKELSHAAVVQELKQKLLMRNTTHLLVGSR